MLKGAALRIALLLSSSQLVTSERKPFRKHIFIVKFAYNFYADARDTAAVWVVSALPTERRVAI